jgi:hypothetical protein
LGDTKGSLRSYQKALQLRQEIASTSFNWRDRLDLAKAYRLVAFQDFAMGDGSRVLLASSGLVLRSLERLFAVSPGFDASNLLTMQVQESGHRFEDDRVTRQFFEEELDVRHFPGVTSAAFTSLLPLSGGEYETYGASFEPAHGHSYDAFRYVVTPGYFQTMGIALRRGRFLEARDTETASPVVLISDSLAKTEFQSRDSMGQRMHVGPSNRPWYTIVGVVGDVKQMSLPAGTASRRLYDSGAILVCKYGHVAGRAGHGNVAALTPAIKSAIWSRSGRWIRIRPSSVSPRWRIYWPRRRRRVASR